MYAKPTYLFLLAALVPWPALAESNCSNKTPIQCYEDGLKQVEIALGRIANLESQLKSMRDDLTQKLHRIEDQMTSLRQSFRSPKSYTETCPRGRNSPCTASCKDPDEMLIGGACLVPGKGENGTGYTQNIGVSGPSAWNCSMGSIPGLPNLGDVEAVAWCIKITR